MCLNAVNEKGYRDSFKTRLAGIDGTAVTGVATGDNVFAEPHFFNNREDYAATMKLVGAAIKSTEIKFVHIEYEDFTDTGRGTDECPELEVRYKIFLYSQYKLIRADVGHTRIYNDFMAWLMNVMNSLVKTRAVGDAEITTVSHAESVRYNEEHPQMPGEKGIFSTLRVVLEVK